jgi:hypothetical protein
MDRCRRGKIKMERVGSLEGVRRLDSSEIPEWLSKAWEKEPEVLVSFRISDADLLSGNDTNQVEYLNIHWYLSGILVGDTNYVTESAPWYLVEVKPGIYVYFAEK